ncbi:MAG: galactose oxidase-like domain-containing protein, partial [Acidimicrobiia bacterium]
ATAPPGGSVAPPGFYYLFVNRSSPSGPVPSVARMVKVGPTSDPAPALQPLADSTVAAGRVAATPTEDSQMSDVGGCAGCRGEERRGSTF